MARLKLQAPWIRYYEELSLFFDEDPGVKVIFDEDNNVISMYVASPTKAEALTRLIPHEHDFGGAILTINIIPGNGVKNDALADFKDAFYGNPIVNDIVTVYDISTNPFTYIIFRKEVVQYWNDDLGDAYGNCTTLWQDVAKRLFSDVDGIYFCTDKETQEEIDFRSLLEDEYF